MKKLNLILLFFALSLFTKAQQTGTFDLTKLYSGGTLNGISKTHSLYVPASFDSLREYKLILAYHGNANPTTPQAMRDNLIPIADSLGAIVISLNHSGTYNSTTVKGQENLQMADWAIDYGFNTYNVNPDQVYIIGFSAGGGAAIRYALDTSTTYKVRGFIPFAPYYASWTADYTNSALFPPTCSCVGQNDAASYHTRLDGIKVGMNANGGVAITNTIPGIAHTMTFANLVPELMECFSFFENQYSNINPTLLPGDSLLTINMNTSAAMCFQAYDFNVPFDTLSNIDTLNNFGAKHGTVTFTSADCISYQPDNNFVGLDSILVFVCDSSAGCDTTKITIDVKSTVGISELANQQKDLLIYPNPFSDVINLASTGNEIIQDIALLDYMGRSVMNSQLVGSNTHQLNTEGLSPGVYFIRLKVANEYKYHQLIKK